MLYETRNLCRHHRAGGRVEVRALQDVSLTIPEGSLTAIVGPSGSGKTTLLALLGALDRPTSGQLLLQGQDLSALSGSALARVRRRIGFVFQDFAIIPGLTSLENVTYPLIPRGVPRAERERRARDWLTQLGMQARCNAPRENSAAANSSVSPWPAHLRATRKSFWLTNRPPISTVKRRTSCEESCERFTCQDERSSYRRMIRFSFPWRTCRLPCKAERSSR